MSDYIDRQAAIDEIKEIYEWHDNVTKERIIEHFNQLPSVQPQRKTGRWILVKGSNGKDYHKCSECLHTQEITGIKNYCAVCGADMRGEQDG